jgi:ribosomal protein L40E
MSETPKEPVRCPKCGSTDVRYSYTQTAWDMILDLLFSMDAFRCRSCRKRFHKFDPGGDDEEQRLAGEKRQPGREDDVSRS